MTPGDDAADLYERSRKHGEVWGPPQDAEHAALLQRAAELGNAQAQRDLGCSHATGEDVLPQDLSRARLWYGKAAAAGHADAQVNFGCMLLLGEGWPKETDTGLDWIRRAAAQRDLAARQYLSEI